MNQRVPNCDLEDINPNHDIYKLDYEVAEITWENGQLTLHELGSRRVPTKSQPTTSWDQPRSAETLEALVNQATLQPYCKTDATFNDNELVPWMHYNNPTIDVNLNNQSATMTSDALVPNTHNRTSDGSAQAQRSIKSAREAGCSTRASSCSGNPFMDPRVARGTTTETYNWSSCKDMSVSGTFVTPDTYTGDLGGRRLTSTSTGSPENTNTSSGRDFSNSTFPDHTACHRRTQSDKASMLDEVIEHIKQLQLQIHTANMMNMSPMMMSLVMQQQLQFQKYMMNSMGMGMGMENIQPRFHPSAFMPSWNNQATDQVVNTNTMPGAPMPAFLAPRNQFDEVNVE
ncbi:hypothetical protein L1987_28522 [Smallanthus sonchifolius]|uniref:Uncharacterized protein n=1 Tax=Smallanthus sonchifolius TaxID=185202 RepID=A0ACB9HYN4_9ASTR|nr:hypothetical protein L1987_28522 [Smallanthus sonchifolius]